MFILALAAFFIALRFSSDASAALLIVTFGAGFCAGVLAFFALFSEITGEAREYRMEGRRFKGEPVARSDAPFRFRRANNLKWGASLFIHGRRHGYICILPQAERIRFPPLNNRFG